MPHEPPTQNIYLRIQALVVADGGRNIEFTTYVVPKIGSKLPQRPGYHKVIPMDHTPEVLSPVGECAW